MADSSSTAALPPVSLSGNGASLRAGFFAGAREEGAEEEAAVRLSFADAGGVGVLDFVEADPDFTIIVSNCFWAADGALRYRGEGWLRFNFCLDANATFRFDGHGAYEMRGRELRVFRQPEGVGCDHLIRGQGRSTCVTVSLRGRHLAGRPELAGDGFFLRRLPLDGAAQQAVTALLDAPRNRPPRRAEVAARARGLVEHALARLGGAAAPAARVVLTEADLAKVRLAREILDRAFAAPPPVGRLARAVGLNRNKLSYGFRQLHDVSMSDWLAERRLEAARQLLQAGALPVTEVAAAVGYSHPASFSTAFRRRYGIAPRQVRAAASGEE